jgi:hypothetical protein
MGFIELPEHSISGLSALAAPAMLGIYMVTLSTL